MGCGCRKNRAAKTAGVQGAQVSGCTGPNCGSSKDTKITTQKATVNGATVKTKKV